MGKERIPTRIPTLDKPWTVLCRITKSKVHDYPVCQLVPKVKAGLNALFTSGFLILLFDYSQPMLYFNYILNPIQ